ncbi:MAG: MbnP family protein [Crocinitomicaceae bacterium]
MRRILTVIAISIACQAISQTPVNLNIFHKLGTTNFAFNQASANNTPNGEFNLIRMEYYLTKFTIIHDGGQMTSASDTVIALVSADQSTHISLGSFNLTNIEGIKFHVGVHTPINHDDPGLQPAGSPLSYQSPSMHWGWSSGYRFIALEGKSSPAMNQTLELHGLGDINYLETNVSALGSLYNGEFEININADYNRALENIDISAGLVVHSEGQQAATMIQNFQNYVFSSSNSLAKVDEEMETSVTIFPIPSTGKFTIETPAYFESNKVKLFSTSGQLIDVVEMQQDQLKTEIEVAEKGIILLEFYQDDIRLFSKTILIK